MDGCPVVTVQLFDREAAVQQLGEQLCVAFTSTPVQRKVIHPLTLPVWNEKSELQRPSRLHSGYLLLLLTLHFPIIRTFCSFWIKKYLLCE